MFRAEVMNLRVKVLVWTATSGGALALTSANVTLVIRDSTLQNNTARTEGGALELMAPGNSALISDSSVVDNRAQAGGAVKACTATLLQLNSSTLAGNWAQLSGGAVKSTGAMLEWTNSTLRGNEAATGDGGALDHSRLTTENSNVTFVSCVFEMNRAAGRGGALFFSRASNTSALMHIHTMDTTMSLNAAGIAGGAIGSSRCQLRLTRTTLSENNASTGTGGALDMDDVDLTSEDNTIFASNNAATNGGSVAMVNSRAAMQLTFFEHNEAALDGGALTLISSSLFGTQLALRGNRAQHAAAIKLSFDSYTNLLNTDLIANEVLGAGAIFDSIDTSRFDLEGIAFRNNSAVLGYTLRYMPSEIQPNPPTIRMCSFFGNFDVISVSILQPVAWTCSLGQYAPQTGSFSGEFAGCPLPCAIGHYGSNANETSPDCTGACPVSMLTSKWLS